MVKAAAGPENGIAGDESLPCRRRGRGGAAALLQREGAFEAGRTWDCGRTFCSDSLLEFAENIAMK